MSDCAINCKLNTFFKNLSEEKANTKQELVLEGLRGVSIHEVVGVSKMLLPQIFRFTCVPLRLKRIARSF
jgi:hypothetical protein